jgi:hypothetical protein
MVVSTSSGIAAVAALGVVGTCLGRFRAVAPPLAPVIIGYIAWLTANPGGGTEASGLGALLDVPGTMWEMVAPTAAGALALPSTLGPVLAVLLVGVLAVWTLRGRLGSFEAVWLLAAVIWMTMIIVARVVPGPVSATAVRYSYLITWFLVPAIVPHLRLSKRAWVRWVTVAAAVLVVVGNVVQLKAGLDDWVSKTSEVRGRIQAVGILAAAGEPALDASHVFIDGVPGPKGFTVGSVRRLLRTEGWVPDPVVAEPYEQAARGVMRMAIDPGPAGHSCQKVTEGEQLSVRTTEYPAIALSAERRSVVDISYIDRYGTGERTVELTGDHVLNHPVGSNALVVFRVTDGAPLQICQPAEDGGDDSAAVPSTESGGDVDEP